MRTIRSGGIALLAAVAGIAAPAPAATRGFPVPGFDRVRSDVPFDVHVHTGRRPGVVANGDQAMLDRLEIGVRGGELVVSVRQGSASWFSGWRGQHAVIDVTVPMVRGATLNGPGNLDVDLIRARDVALSVSGPGTLRIGTIDTAHLDTVLRGPGDIAAAGHAGFVKVLANGPGNVRFAKLAARDIDVTLNGPGDVDAMAGGNARLVLNGPGDIRVGGHPRCSVEKHGPGDVSCA